MNEFDFGEDVPFDDFNESIETELEMLREAESYEDILPDEDIADLFESSDSSRNETKVDQVAADIPTSEVKASSFTAKSFGVEGSTKRSHIVELALELQALRKTITQNRPEASANSFSSFDMATTQPAFLVDRDSSKYLYQRPPAGSHEAQGQLHLTCVLDNGNRLFLRRRAAAENSGSNTVGVVITGKSNNSGSSSSQLLAKPISELLKEAERMRVHTLAQQQKRDDDKREAELYGGRRQETTAEDRMLQEKGLWVEKYTPKAFSQLLSPEKTNREVLKALKQWDKYIFKKDLPGGSTGTGNAGTAAAAQRGFPAGGQKKGLSPEKEGNEKDADGDDDNDAGGYKSQHKKYVDPRPQYKVILLAGPPGTGKTTLAHIVAKHCGYRPLEVNASDDRSSDVLRDTMVRAMHGNTLYGEQRPNCIILDEIDGIDGRASIDTLVSIVKAPLRSAVAASGNGAGGKKVAHAQALTRPLICVCNDQFAPALRELRKVSQIFVFQPPAEIRLVQRLKAVCSNEGLIVPATSLTTLCTAVGNDIRSAINTLQFASLRTRKAISDANGGKGKGSTASSSSASASASALSLGNTLSSMISSGLKDEQKDAFQIWREVFSQKEMTATLAAKRSRQEGGLQQLSLVKPHNTTSTTGTAGTAVAAAAGASATAAAATAAAGPAPAMEAMHAVGDYGDHNLILGGIFENILKVRFADPTMIKTQAACDWLSLSDQLDSWTRVGADGFQVLPYISASAGAVHLLCASEQGRVRIDWPTKDKESFYKRQQRDNILHGLLEGGFGSSVLCTKKIVAVDVLHSLMDIISPRVRPVPFITLSTSEQDCLMGSVRAMSSCGLGFSTNVSDSPVSFYDKNNHRPHFGFGFGAAAGGGFGGGGGGFGFSGTTTTLKLDPAIEDLLGYAQSLALIENKYNPSSSSSSFLGGEQGSGGVAVQQPYSKPPANSVAARGLEVLLAEDTIGSRRVPLANEIKNVMFTELKKYTISMKAQHIYHGEVVDEYETAMDEVNNSNSSNYYEEDNDYEAEEALFLQESSAAAATATTSTITTSAAVSVHTVHTGATATATATAIRPVPKKSDPAAAATAAAPVTEELPEPVKEELLPELKKTRMDAFFNKRSSGGDDAKKRSAADSAGGQLPLSVAAAKKAKKAKAVHFKFNQGFSNAVRRTVFINEFL